MRAVYDRVLVLSDLHLPRDPGLSSHVGAEDLDAALSTWTGGAGRTLVVFNGDVLDLLTDDDPLAPDGVDLAEQRVRALLAEGPGAAWAAAVRGLLRSGVEVRVRAGNHDLELAHPVIQAAMRTVLAGGGTPTHGLSFDADPFIDVEVGGRTVRIAHGDEADVDNRWARPAVGEPAFRYPPGSKVVKRLVNRAKQEGLGFIDMMEPMVAGAVAMALLIKPEAFNSAGPEDERAMTDLLGAGLRRRAPWPFGDPDALVGEPDALIGTAAIQASAALARWFGADGRLSWFQPFPAMESLEPTEGEWADAEAIRGDGRVSVVITGHTHQPRLAAMGDLILANPGSWTWRLAGPGRTEGAAAWEAFEELLRADPGLQGAARSLAIRQTGAVRVEADGRVELLRWHPGGSAVVSTRALRPQALAALVQPAAPRDATDRARAVRDEAAAILAASSTPAAPGADLRLTAADRLVPRPLRALMMQLVEAALPANGPVTPDALVRAETVWGLYEEARGQRLAARDAAAVHALDAMAFEGYRLALDAAGKVGMTARARAAAPWVRLVPDLSPLTLRREARYEVPHALRSRVTVPLHALPFPIVSFPPDWLGRPAWWVVLLHELGHDLDTDLGLSDALLAHRETWASTGAFRGMWEGWVDEIVADLVMLALGGPGTVTVLDAVLGEVVGYAGMSPLDHPHPPPMLRVALLRAAAGRLWPGVVPAISAPRAEELAAAAGHPLLAHVDPLAAALVDAGPDGTSAQALVRALARAEGAWCRYPADLLTDPARPRPATDPAVVDPDWQGFATRWATTYAPTRGLDPSTLYKTPPLALLLAHDRVVFVGATHGQLASTLRAAWALRAGRRWASIDVLFLTKPVVAAMEAGERTAEVLLEERGRAITELSALLPEVCAEGCWSLRQHDDPSLFASFWGPADPAALQLPADCPWVHVHTSARLWGGEIRTSPSIDYQWQPYGHNTQLRALAHALRALLQRAARIAP